MSLPKWAPKPPKYTCPDIDTFQKRIDDRIDELDTVIDELRGMRYDMEKLREENAALRSWGEDVAANGQTEIENLANELSEAREKIDRLERGAQ